MMSTNTNTTAPAEFGYVTAHTAGGGAGGARHIVARKGTYFNGYADAAICGTAPAGRWGTGSSAIKWTADMNMSGEYGDTVYSTPAEAAAARPVCRRCAAAAAKMAAAAAPEAAPAAPAEALEPAAAEALDTPAAEAPAAATAEDVQAAYDEYRAAPIGSSARYAAAVNLEHVKAAHHGHGPLTPEDVAARLGVCG